MNPMALLQLKGAWDTFKANHPKFPLFLNAVYKNGLEAGNVVEISVRTKEGRDYTTNLKLTPSDMELFYQMREMLKN